MKKGIIILVSMLVSMSVYSQHVGIKNNLLYDAALTPNLGLEIGLGKKATLDISGNYNPFKLGNHRQYKHWMVQPEFRLWTCEKFNGLFFGLHGIGGEFSIARIKLPFGLYKQLRDHRYEGYFYGGGITVGYQWVLSKHWNLEAAIGGGYMRIHYDKYPCPDCGPKIWTGNYNYWGPTKAAISLIYVIH